MENFEELLNNDKQENKNNQEINNRNSDFKFKVNLGGMIDILSNHLYSSPDVVVRELLQNCTDAISARLAKDGDFSEDSAKVEIDVDDGKQIIFRDNGTGLTENEIHKFLAVIGQSSKYDIKNSRANGDFIGRFGIGLLSCFMITDTICVRTRSFAAPDVVMEWNGNADGTYTIRQIEYDMNIGTEMIICNNKADKNEDVVDDYFSADTVANLVYYFGLFLKYPIILIKNGKQQRLNLKFDFDVEHNKKKCMDAGKLLLGESFLDCFELKSENGYFEGIAYVVPYPVSATVHNMHRIYLKNMLLTESGEKLLPEWAFFIRCIINTKNLKPTSSREDFYEDENLKKARAEIADCIAEYLEMLDSKNSDMLYEIVRVHHLTVKSIIAATNGLDNVLMPYLLFETSLGQMSGRDIMEFGGEAFYTCDVNQFRQLAPLYTQRTSLLINAGYVYERAIMEKISEKSEVTSIERLTDSDIDFMLDESDYDCDSDALRVCEIASKVLRKYDCKAELKAFHPFEIPTLYTINESAMEQRQIKRAKESADALFMGMLEAFEEEESQKSVACLYLNTNNLIIEKLFNMQDEDKIKCYIEILYVQALLSGHFPLLHDEMKVLNENLYKIMMM